MKDEKTGAERFRDFIYRVSDGNLAAVKLVESQGMDFDDLTPQEIIDLARKTAMVAASLYQWAIVLNDKVDEMRGS
jgi:hypothetical protein